jgi:glycerol uptake facilitator protein
MASGVSEHSLVQRAVAEAVGAALLVFVGAGSVPAVLLLGRANQSPFSGADLGIIAVVFGFVVAALIYTVGKVSGCHINPAVTFAFTLVRRFPRRELGPYVAAQMAGAALGGFAIWGVFGRRAINLGYGFGATHFDSAVTSWASAVLAEGLGTAVLLFVVFGVVDRRAPEGWAGLVIGLIVTALVLTLGPVTGGAINPARAFGPLFVLTVAGSVHNWLQWLVYAAAELAGAAVAAYLYLYIARPRIPVRPIRQAASEDVGT